MKRKTSEVPTRIYSYGCCPPDVNREGFDGQLRAAHEYRNALVEIERRRRARVEAEHRKEPRLDDIAARLGFAEDAYESALEWLNAAKAGDGRDADGPRELYQAVLAQLRALEREWTATKAAARKTNPDLVKRIRGCSDAAYLEAKALYNAPGALHWGTKLMIAKEAEAANRGVRPPRFLRWEGEGRVGVQLGDGGLTVADLLAGKNGQVQLLPQEPPPGWHPPMHLPIGRQGGRGRESVRMRIKIRVGSMVDEKGRRTREPVWISARCTIDRPLPPDGVVKWVWILKRRVAYRDEYRIQFVVQAPGFAAVDPTQAGVACGQDYRGTVAVDVGWRDTIDGNLRVAYCLDDRGVHGQIAVPEGVVGRIAHADSLDSIRSRHLDAVRDRLIDYIGPHARGERREGIPEWLFEATRGIVLWKSPARFAGLLRRWERHEGDGDIYALLSAWAKNDRHLWSWSAHETDRAIGHRNDEYRKVAVHLARTYGTIVIETRDVMDLTKHAFAEVPYPDADEDPADGRRQRSGKRLAAPGTLRAYIVEAADKYGARIVEVDPAQTTQQCHLCGFNGRWDARPSATHACAGCGAEWDQDHNACVNLLACASGSAMTPSPEPLEAPRIAGESVDVVNREDGRTRPPKGPRRDRSIRRSKGGEIRKKAA